MRAMPVLTADVVASDVRLAGMSAVVFARDRCCVLCGRPRPDALHRRAEPGIVGDVPANFSAMCGGCARLVRREGPRPARYVIRVVTGPVEHIAWIVKLGLLAFALATVALVTWAAGPAANAVLIAVEAHPLDAIGAASTGPVLAIAVVVVARRIARRARR